MKKLKGTAIEELVKTNKLNKADILLAHSKRNFWGYLIRFGTHSYWNHAFIVGEVGIADKGYGKTLIIDSRGGNINTNAIIIVTLHR